MASIDLIKNTIFWCATSILTIFVSYQLYLATTWGAGLSPDSITYLEGARSILKNWNFDGIGTHYPPLYFILIVLVSLITGDALEALRWLQLLTIAANCILMALIVWKGTDKRLLPTIICLLLFVTSGSVLYIHTMAWSEGSFCFWALLGFYFLSDYLEPENNRFYLLTLAALFIGLAFVTRYAGITLIVTGVIVLALYAVGSKRKRLTDCFYFGAVSMLPMLVWVGRNWFFSNELTNRQLTVHLISTEQIQAGINVLLRWLFIPGGFSSILLILLGLLVVIYILSVKFTEFEHFNRTLEICFVFISIYIPFLLVSISLFDAHTPLDIRILFPVYLFFVLGSVLLSYRVYHAKNIVIISYLMFMALVLLTGVQFVIQRQYLSTVATQGIGFSSKQWSQSVMLQWVKKLPPDIAIYTNGPDAIRVIANRPSRMIPRLVSPEDRKENKYIKRDINQMAAKLSEGKGVIVYFNAITWRWYLPTPKQLSQMLSLRLVYQSEDGIALEVYPQSEK